MIVGVPRHEYTLAVARSNLRPSVKRALTVLAELTTWTTGLVPRYLTSQGLADEQGGVDERNSQRAVADALDLGWLDVYQRGPLRQPYYALTLPWKPLRRVRERAGAALGRFADRVKSVVADVAGAVRELVREPHTGPVAPLYAPPEHVVAFTGGSGPAPTLMRRPSFSEGPRGDGYARREASPERRGRGGDPARLGTDLGWLDPGPAPSTARGDPVDAAAPPLGISEDPVDTRGDPVPGDHSPEPWQERDARHVGRLYASREEAAAAARQPHGPGDHAPHRRVELLYRRLFVQARGLEPPIIGTDRVAIQRLIARLGVDAAEDTIRAAFARYAHCQGRSIQEIAYAAGVMGRAAPEANGGRPWDRWLQPGCVGPPRYLEEE